MTSPLAALFAALTPAQREALAARQRDPAVAALVRGDGPRVAKVVPRPSRGVDAFARVDGGAVILTAKGLRLVNAANAREHWRARQRRARRERGVVAAALAGVEAPPGPWRVTITRDGRGTMDDDGLAAAGKAVRDAVAAWLGVDDSPAAPVAWHYCQRRAKGYAVTVRVEAMDTRPARG